jgi:hypothetical protein
MLFYAPGDRHRMRSFDGTVTFITRRFSMVETVIGHPINSNKKVILTGAAKFLFYSLSVSQAEHFRNF